MAMTMLTPVVMVRVRWWWRDEVVSGDGCCADGGVGTDAGVDDDDIVFALMIMAMVIVLKGKVKKRLIRRM